MKNCQRAYGPEHRFSRQKAFLGHGFVQLRGKLMGNATHAMDGQMTVAIGGHIPLQEQAEMLHQPVVEEGVRHMAGDEGHQRGQEPVGLGLAVHVVDDRGHGELVFLLQLRHPSGGQEPLVEVGEEIASKHGPASLIAQHIAQRRRVGDNAGAVIETAVRPRAQDAGYAGLMAAQCACGPQKVAFHPQGCLREEGGQGIGHSGGIGRDASGTIKTDA